MLRLLEASRAEERGKLPVQEQAKLPVQERAPAGQWPV